MFRAASLFRAGAPIESHISKLPATCGQDLKKAKFVNLLLAGIANVLVSIKKRSDVHCLTTPDTSVDSPVKR